MRIVTYVTLVIVSLCTGYLIRHNMDTPLVDKAITTVREANTVITKCILNLELAEAVLDKCIQGKSYD